jgi:dipeptidyl aminopeptidase/acylaminoacyl peptidase
VYDAAKPRLAEFARRSSVTDEKNAAQSAVISFPDPAGRTIGALLTVPGPSRPSPAGLVVLCASDPWQRVHTDYRRDVEALAEMGLAVLQINARGAFGFGLKQREALKPKYEEAQVEDILSTLDYLQKYVPLNFKRVVTMGTDWGGFVALRAVQLYPDRFRAAIALDPTVDPGDWLANLNTSDGPPGVALTRSYYGDAAHLKAAPLMHAPEKVSKPILVLSYEAAGGGPAPAKYLAARHFATAVRGAGGWAEFDALPEDYMRGLPHARAATYEKIAGFLNDALFKFEVKVGETKEVKP